MDEKKAIKNLRRIETEIKHMEKQIKRAERSIKVWSKDRNIFLFYFLLFLSAVVIETRFWTTSDFRSHMVCYTAGIIIAGLIFAGIFALLFGDRQVLELGKSKKIAECWIRYCEKEKERILKEHPELKDEEIRPYRLHYWDMFFLYSVVVMLGYFILVETTKNTPNSLIWPSSDSCDILAWKISLLY